MTIFVVGTRGIPNVQGGVETHIEELCPRLLNIGVKRIVVFCRSCYFPGERLKEYKGIELKYIYAPANKYSEAIVHTSLSVIYALFNRPSLLHIHAVGPNLITPLARLFGLKVVMTHHGPDYERKKWGFFAKVIIRAGEFAGVKFANKVISISNPIREQIEQQLHRKDVIVIPNGVPAPVIPVNSDYLSVLGVEKKKYIFTLGRFVPEKGFDYLIKAFKASNLSKEYKLVIAGDADHESSYSLALKKQAKENDVMLTGFIKGDHLHQLFYNCFLFVLPSFYEGLPISLLEAMSYGLPILASDIIPNKEVELPDDNYFEVGNIEKLTKKFNEVNIPADGVVQYDMEKYNWDKIAQQTLDVYKLLLSR